MSRCYQQIFRVSVEHSQALEACEKLLTYILFVLSDSETDSFCRIQDKTQQNIRNCQVKVHQEQAALCFQHCNEEEAVNMQSMSLGILAACGGGYCGDCKQVYDDHVSSMTCNGCGVSCLGNEIHQRTAWKQGHKKMCPLLKSFKKAKKGNSVADLHV